jgi:hypothetical protein
LEGLGMDRSLAFKAAHAATRKAIAEQIEIKHPSAHKTYAQLFKLCLQGYYILEADKRYVPVEKLKFMWLRGM